MPPRPKTETLQVSVHYLRIGDVIRLGGLAHVIKKLTRISNEKIEIRCHTAVSVDDEETILVIPAKGVLEVIREVNPEAYYFSFGTKYEAWEFFVELMSGEPYKPEVLEKVEQLVRETQQ